ncbi:transposase [Blautia sp. CLA-JM-H16]|uniref:Transposase n=1 Tax=Blautia aquisgranensis TaxID=3133153 RepID=A0ABV1BIB4_9FIRM
MGYSKKHEKTSWFFRKISGDTVIRLLLRKYEVLSGPEVGDVIGVDDFAYKKRHTYGTIIVNEENHEPIALLDGRNGDTLRDWLRNNKHIKGKPKITGEILSGK